MTINVYKPRTRAHRRATHILLFLVGVLLAMMAVPADPAGAQPARSDSDSQADLTEVQDEPEDVAKLIGLLAEQGCEIRSSEFARIADFERLPSTHPQCFDPARHVPEPRQGDVPKVHTIQVREITTTLPCEIGDLRGDSNAALGCIDELLVSVTGHTLGELREAHPKAAIHITTAEPVERVESAARMNDPCNFASPTVVGTTGNDILIGGDDAQHIIQGLGGRDLLIGFTNDWLCGNEGDDTLIAFRGGLLLGEGGEDALAGIHLYPSAGRNFEIYGGEENDHIYGGSYHVDWLHGGPGIDYIEAFRSGDFAFIGGDSATPSIDDARDTIQGTDGSDVIWGGAGGDYVRGWGGADTIFGEAGADIIRGDDNGDKIYGGAGEDTLHAGQGTDRISGGDDDDFITGGDGWDKIWGDGGNDEMYGQNGRDKISGGTGTLDEGDGGNGNDNCRSDVEITTSC